MTSNEIRAGLCATCRHCQRTGNNRGSEFYLCKRADSDEAFTRYPRLPVHSCRGYEAPADDS